jgi:large subunit ribosomal protein L23
MASTMTKSAMRKIRNSQRQFRMWLPTMPLTLVSARSASPSNPAYAIFRTIPRMTKHEIKEYLTKIYDLPVRVVRTMNYLGKRKRMATRTGVVYFRYKDFKKAVVYFDDTLKDVGIGTRVPEMEDGVRPTHAEQTSPRAQLRA